MFSGFFFFILENFYSRRSAAPTPRFLTTGLCYSESMRKNVVVPVVPHDRTIIFEIHVDYFFSHEVTHDRAMFLAIYVHNFIVLEVSHDRTMILVIQVYYSVVAEIS